MQNYETVHGSLPPAAVRDRDGRPLLSWRVLILPYLEQRELFEEFKLDEPWDSPHNLQLLERMPSVFRPYQSCPTADSKSTFYQVFTGKGSIFEGPRCLSFSALAAGDGTSNTFLIVEGGEAVPWTKPADLVAEPDQPLPKLGGIFPDSFRAAFADGSVRQILRKGTTEAAIRAAITWNGCERHSIENSLSVD